MRSTGLIIVISLLFGFTLKTNHPQSSPKIIQFAPLFNGQPLYNKIKEVNDTFNITKFQFYLSHFELWNKGKLSWSEPNSFHLLDAFNLTSMMIKLYPSDSVEFDQVKFMIGVDSVTSVSGAFGGDLDPTNGMYWAWNSGYIHVKLEGTSMFSTAHNRAFTLHLGGYKQPNATVNQLNFSCENGQLPQIQIDLDAFFKGFNWSENQQIMSEGQKAHDLAASLSKCFIKSNGN